MQPPPWASGRGGEGASQRGSNMSKRVLGAALALALFAAAGIAAAADFQPAVVFDMGGKFDKSFNEGVYNGVEKFKADTGIAYREFEVTNETQREQALTRMAPPGADPVLSVGFAQAPALAQVAQEPPTSRFALIDAVVDLPYVPAIVFQDHAGSFLVPVLLPLASKTGQA